LYSLVLLMRSIGMGPFANRVVLAVSALAFTLHASRGRKLHATRFVAGGARPATQLRVSVQLYIVKPLLLARAILDNGGLLYHRGCIRRGLLATTQEERNLCSRLCSSACKTGNRVYNAAPIDRKVDSRQSSRLT
jgi:hypothetical protein